MKKIAYQRPDGGLSICIPVVSMNDPEGFTEEMAFERAMKNDIPADAVNVHIVEDRDIHRDRTFRNAWRTDGKALRHDMVHAREIATENVRRARAPEFQALDAAYMQALERKDETTMQDVAVRKQVLRDAPADPRIQSAATADDLKTAMQAVIAGMAESAPDVGLTPSKPDTRPR